MVGKEWSSCCREEEESGREWRVGEVEDGGERGRRRPEGR